MSALFFEGILLGLTLVTFFGFGPAFFALVQTSIHRGFGPAALLAIGIFLNDVVMVVLCLMGAVQIVTAPSNYLWFGISSGVILIIFGLVTYTRKVSSPSESADDEVDLPVQMKGPSWFTYIAKGFFMNIVNPFVWIFWVGVVVGISARMGGDETRLTTFFSGTLITVLLGDLLKAYGAYSIKRFFTSRMIGLLNKIAGIGLIIFGLFLIGRVIFEYSF
ncbi:MAG TPA: LysE family transporter [Bacteroidales bacterium]|nr:LysE family transporter [Bacteroidales bacterium]MDD4087005.1 LysE family transporter [Bacteroidales bacterium]HPE42804.1 LysE family transporter [Bacteroidales bacterium]